MPLATDTSAYDAVDFEPKSNPDALTLWWLRRIAFYFPYKVKMERREVVEGLDFLYFKLARNEDLGPFKVELTQQTRYVWSDLPSTAQKATKALPYGILMLSPSWEEEVQEGLKATNSSVRIRDLREGGQKWPLSAELPIETFKNEVQSAIRTLPTASSLKPKLQGLLNLLDTSNPQELLP